MRTLLEILTENTDNFKLSEFDQPKYNAMDHPEHMTGRTATGKTQCVYSVYAINIKEDHCFTQNINAWGRYIDEVHPLSHLVKYPEET
jgi:hypothetical protein